MSLQNWPILLSLGFFSASSWILVKGEVNGFGRLRTDNVLDVAVVVQPPSAETLLQMEFPALLAPAEKMKAGPFSEDVPGNLFVPEQSEKYGIFPVTLRKNSFSAPVENHRPSELVALWLKGDWEQLIDGTKAKWPIWKLLQHIKIHGLTLDGAKRRGSLDKAQLFLGLPSETAGRWNWTRSATAKDEFDLAAFLQPTPAGGWIPADLSSGAPGSGAYKLHPTLSQTTWALFSRVRMDGKKFRAARGHWIRHQDRTKIISVTDLPIGISAPQKVGSQIRWDIHNGWNWMLAVGTLEASNAARREHADQRGVFLDFGLWDLPAPEPLNGCSGLVSLWAPDESGSLEIPHEPNCPRQWVLTRLDVPSSEIRPPIDHGSAADWNRFAGSVTTFASQWIQ